MLKGRLLLKGLIEGGSTVTIHSLEEAFELAKSLVRVDNYSVTVIPDGVAVMVKEI